MSAPPAKLRIIDEFIGAAPLLSLDLGGTPPRLTLPLNRQHSASQGFASKWQEAVWVQASECARIAADQGGIDSAQIREQRRQADARA